MTDTETKIKIANNRLVATGRRYWRGTLIALVVTAVVWPHLSSAWALAAGAGLVIANHIMTIINHLYWRDAARDARPEFWENWLVLGNLISGTAMGLIYAWLFLALPPEVSPQLLLIATLVIGARTNSNSPAMKCVYAFFLPAMLSILFTLVLQGTALDFAGAIVIVLFFSYILKHARVISNAYRASAELSSGMQAQVKARQQEKEIAEQASLRWRLLMDALPVPVLVSHMKTGRIVYANHPTLAFIGIQDLSDNPNISTADFFADPTERDRLLRKYMHEDGSIKIEAEFQMKRGDGTLIWAVYTGNKMTYEGEPAHIGSFLDITAWREAKDAQRQSEEKFRLLAEHAHDLISIYSLDSVCLYASPSLERLLGYQQNEFVGRPLKDFAHPEDYDIILSSNASSAKLGGAPPRYLFRMLHKNGGWEWMEATSTVERDPRTGRFSHVSSVSRLVTERVKHEQELEDARMRAETSDRAKSEFLSHMSHEIRTPLNAVIGFSEVMRDELFGPLGSPRYVEYMNDIHNSGTHLLDLINDILDLSKIEAGKFELQEDRAELRAIVEGACRLMHERAHVKRLDLQSNLDAAPDLWCDRRALTQILINLIGNAVKFTPEQGRITVESRLDAGGNLILSVTDTGIGIAAEDIPKMMQPFTQARNTSDTTNQAGGTGLGLTLCKSLAEKHGGTLTITSEAGFGTCVSLTLPASRLMRDEQDDQRAINAF